MVKGGKRSLVVTHADNKLPVGVSKAHNVSDVLMSVELTAR